MNWSEWNLKAEKVKKKQIVKLVMIPDETSENIEPCVSSEQMKLVREWQRGEEGGWGKGKKYTVEIAEEGYKRL